MRLWGYTIHIACHSNRVCVINIMGLWVFLSRVLEKIHKLREMLILGLIANFRTHMKYKDLIKV